MNNNQIKKEIKNKIIKIIVWFQNTDYYVNKIIRGEWTETNETWIAYKQEAKVKALELEKLEEELTLLRQQKKHNQ
jgi:hypothetical protein